MSSRTVVLCADDYGISAGVSGAILDLAVAGRLSAASAMVHTPAAAAAAAAWRDVGPPASIGLHLSFTWGQPLGPMPGLAPNGVLPPLGRLLRAALSRGLDLAELAAEVDRQVHRFGLLYGRDPDFVDGHQHVHVLPGIRRALLSRLHGRRSWVRHPGDRAARVLFRGSAIGKALGLSMLATGFRRAAGRAGLRTNDGFAGFSDFAPGRDLDRDFAGFLDAPGPRHLVMCHPGRVAEGERLDGIEAARESEREYLASPEFGALLARRNVRLVPGFD